jgi:hypothetical protein
MAPAASTATRRLLAFLEPAAEAAEAQFQRLSTA